MEHPGPIHVALGIVVHECLKEKRKRKIWSKDWLTNKKKFGSIDLLKELETKEPTDFKNYLRMDSGTFYHLLRLVEPRIKNNETRMREAVSAKERLAVTLRYLATGDSFEDLKFSTAISLQLIGLIVPETCKAIFIDLFFKKLDARHREERERGLRKTRG